MSKKYDNYKDSGIDWIGEIPEHWHCSRLKNLVKEPLKYGANESAEDDNPSNPRYIRITDFGNDGLLKSDTFKSLPIEVASNFLLEEGDLLFARSGATVGKTFLFKNYNGIACYAGYLIKATFDKSKIDSTYIDYFTRSNYYENWKLSVFQQATIQNIGADKYNQLIISIPKSIEEQQSISNYLDHKTTQIDNLIAKKEQFINLLQEERTAVINQAVTKGLDPKVKMKDAGIEWLGVIPEHWEVKRIGHIAKVVRGASPRPAGDPLLFNGDFLPWITVKEVTNAVGKYIESTETFLTELGANQTRILDPETLILSNSGATLGVPRISKIRGGINDGSVAFFNLKIERDYLYYFFITHTNIYREEASGYGQPNLNTDIVKSTKIPVPLMAEQIEIILFIEKELSKFEELISKSQQEIELLKEYKTALISEVVTGKIDVRDVVLN